MVLLNRGVAIHQWSCRRRSVVTKLIQRMGLISARSTYNPDVLERSNVEFDVSARQNVAEVKDKSWTLELELTLDIHEKVGASEEANMQTAFEIIMRYRLELDNNDIKTDALKKEVYAATWPYCRKDIDTLFCLYQLSLPALPFSIG